MITVKQVLDIIEKTGNPKELIISYEDYQEIRNIIKIPLTIGKLKLYDTEIKYKQTIVDRPASVDLSDRKLEEIDVTKPISVQATLGGD